MQFERKLYRARFLTLSERRTFLTQPLNPSIWKMLENLFLKIVGFQPSAKTGFCFGTEALSAQDSFTHSCTIAATGSGKTQSCVLPSLMLSPDASFVVTDPSGELLELSSGYLKSQDYEIQVLDFRDGATNSHCYNPLSGDISLPRLKEKSERLFEAAQNGATRQSENGQFWKVQAVSTIYVLMWLLTIQPKKYRNMYNLRLLIQRMASHPKDIREMVLKSRSFELMREFETIISGEQKVVQNAISTALTAVDKWSDRHISALTAKSNLDLHKLREQKTALFIIVPEERVRYYAPITSLLFQDLFAMAMKTRKGDERYRSILFLIEEAANVGILNGNFCEIISTIRKRNVGISLIFQSVSQIYNAVGKQNAETILANCLTKCFLSGMDLPTAQMLVQLLGRTTMQYTDLQSNIREGSRELLTVDEIMCLPKDMALFTHKTNRPGLLRITPAYRQPILKRRMRIKGELYLPAIPTKIPRLHIPSAAKPVQKSTAA